MGCVAWVPSQNCRVFWQNLHCQVANGEVPKLRYLKTLQLLSDLDSIAGIGFVFKGGLWCIATDQHQFDNDFEWVYWNQLSLNFPHLFRFVTFAVQVGEHGSHAHLTSQRRTWVAAHQICLRISKLLQDLPSVADIHFSETVVLQSHATKLINCLNMIIPIQMCTKTEKLVNRGIPRGEDSPALQALSILPSATVEMNLRRTMAGRLLHWFQLVSSIGSRPLWNLINSPKASSSCQISEFYLVLTTSIT